MNDKKREQQKPQPDSERKPERHDYAESEEKIRESTTIRDTYKPPPPPPPPPDDGDKSD